MKHPFLTVALSATLALVGFTRCLAADAKAQPPARAASQAHAATKPAAPAKLVNINGASAKELKTLPGITDALAAKIIAGRPYGSKAQLATRKIIGEAEFQGLRHLVIAKQPYKDAARNAAAQAAKKP